MKLKSLLRKSSPERLRSIADFWEIPLNGQSAAADGETLADYLYPRLQSPSHFRQAYEKLGAREREWVYLSAIHGGELPVEEFRRRCGFDSGQRMSEAVTRMGERGFLWRERIRDKLIGLDLVGIPEPFLRLIELPPYWQGFLGFYLHGLGSVQLKWIMENTLGEGGSSRGKQALVHYVRRRMLDPEGLKHVLSGRHPTQLEMFQQILHKNGMCAWRDLLEAGAYKRFDHGRSELLRELVEQSGLVFVYRSASNMYNNLLIAPRDVAYTIQSGYRKDERSLEELGRPAQEINATRVRPRPQLPSSVILDNSNNILRDLVILCAYIQRNPVKMLNNGSLGRNDLKKIVPLLSHNKTLKYTTYLALFAIVRKLIIAVGNQWRVSGSLIQWLQQGPQACFQEVYDFWLTANEWNEEFVDGDVVHADNYPQDLINITELRKLVLRMLRKLPSHAWIDFNTFAESLLPQIAIELPGHVEPSPAGKFNRHPSLIIESMLAESLYWLGVIALGVADLNVAQRLGSRHNDEIAPYDPAHPLTGGLVGRDDTRFCFKLSDFGAVLLSRPYLNPEKVFARMPDPELPYCEETLYFTVQPNQEIITPPDLALDRLFRVLQFANIKKVDVMTTLSITRESLRAGLDTGLTAPMMIELLGACSRKELPETVRQLVNECDSCHGEVDMGLAGGYLKVNDPMHLEEIKANSKIAPAIKDVFGDRLILLNRTADFKKIARELQRLGHMPHVDSDSLYETNDGLFQVTLRTDELYDLLAILRFAILMEGQTGESIFEERVRPLFQRLSINAQDKFNPKLYAESIAKVFLGKFEKATQKTVDAATKKYRRQVNRLMTQMPRTGSCSGYRGQNPATEPPDITRLIKYAIENEVQVRICYQRSSGEVVDEVIEPEGLQAKKVHAFCPDQGAHHTYALERVRSASISG